jgi:hypothetical protein
MKDRKSAVKAVFGGIARVQSTFGIQCGPLAARGLPAVLVAIGGIVLAGGIASALSKAAPRLPETFSEARGLAEAMNVRLRLKS